MPCPRLTKTCRKAGVEQTIYGLVIELRKHKRACRKAKVETAIYGLVAGFGSHGRTCHNNTAPNPGMAKESHSQGKG